MLLQTSTTLEADLHKPFTFELDMICWTDIHPLEVLAQQVQTIRKGIWQAVLKAEIRVHVVYTDSTVLSCELSELL